MNMLDTTDLSTAFQDRRRLFSFASNETGHHRLCIERFAIGPRFVVCSRLAERRTVAYAGSLFVLAAYILEKWSRWSNTEHDVDQSLNAGLDRFTLDQLLSNVMLYWTTGTIASSMRIYYEYFTGALSGEISKLLDGPLSTTVPVAIVNHRHELLYVPRCLARTKYPNIQQWSYQNTGGHFASLEQPREYVRELEKFLLQLEQHR
jgi:pimeloyl-ACP methyl ester carboxylesterase